MFTVAIIGKPNVGKTTLFNKMVGKRLGITHDMPGTTRDRNESIVSFSDMTMKVVDTSGIENLNKNISLYDKMNHQALLALKNCNLCLFVIDGKHELTKEDRVTADLVRKYQSNVILVVNKIDNIKKSPNIDIAMSFKESVAISAEHSVELHKLYKMIKNHYNEYVELNNTNKPEDTKSIKIAIIGRPNAGKSTLINNLLSEDRVVTDSKPGTTIDQISLHINHNGNDIELIDTAGIRKKSNINEQLEELSVDESFKAIQFCHIAVLVMDIQNALESQDLALAHQVINEKRILILIFNKWDLIQTNQQVLIDKIKDRIAHSIPQIKNIPFFTASAKNDNNLSALLDESVTLFNKWNTKISTAKLNKHVIQINSQLGIKRNKQLKIKYITQIKTKPPVFVAFTNFDPDKLNQSEITNIEKLISRTLELDGLPVKIFMRYKSNKNQSN